jgi:catechol O-methyltransferase
MRQAGSAKPDQVVKLLSLEFDPVIADIARNLIDLAGLSDIVTVVVGSAANSLRKLHSEGTLDYMDLLFLDHVEDLYLSDFQVCESLGLLRSGALVVADNVLRPGAPQYREFMRGYNKVESWAVKGLIIPGELEVSFAYLLIRDCEFY